MHNHARHATTSPAAGGQQRKRRHRGPGTATTHACDSSNEVYFILLFIF
jgi:hypothetical protein